MHKPGTTLPTQHEAGPGQPYDPIVADLCAVIDPLWRWPSDHNLLPGHVVCSSLAAMLFGLPSVGWAHPDLGTERQCEPADWWRWSQAHACQSGS